MVVVGGILTPYLEDITKKTFFGIGFGTSGIPIDILPIYFISSYVSNYTLLIVDQFLKLNGEDEAE
ncbi:hypothetical protein HYX12_02090, partial [Candidatus Woesearchaeota archaeon]|nr:hypothetical protein [Candidatus Woesearchaeota archaeon]